MRAATDRKCEVRDGDGGSHPRLAHASNDRSMSMSAWVVDQPAPIDEGPLMRVQRDIPAPGPGEIRVRVLTCGVCRTDLHLAEGELPPKHPQVTPGHEIVGVVDERGRGADRFQVGQRVGVPWLGRTDGRCRFCRSGRENLCLNPTFTGWEMNGGYADACVADEAFVYALPDGLSDEQASPLLCAGIIGFRALKCADLPPGGRLGLYGFGGSAHLAAQIALHQGARVHVLTRGAANQQLARELGVDSVGGTSCQPPEKLDSAILFAPAGHLVPVALEALDRGGTLAVAGIYLSGIPPLSYERNLFEERALRSVTANTRADGEEFLRLAERFGIQATTHGYPMADAPRALSDLKHGRFAGTAVLNND